MILEVQGHSEALEERRSLRRMLLEREVVRYLNKYNKEHGGLLPEVLIYRVASSIMDKASSRGITYRKFSVKDIHNRTKTALNDCIAAGYIVDRNNAGLLANVWDSDKELYVSVFGRKFLKFGGLLEAWLKDRSQTVVLATGGIGATIIVYLAKLLHSKLSL